MTHPVEHSSYALDETASLEKAFSTYLHRFLRGVLKLTRKLYISLVMILDDTTHVSGL